jgi:hypothetical protein
MNSLKKLVCLGAIALSVLPIVAQAGEEGPLFIGSLLDSPGETLPKGHANIEPYLFWTNKNHAYDSSGNLQPATPRSKLSPTLIASYGLNDFMDIQTTIPYMIKYLKTHTHSGFSDISVQLGIQLFKTTEDNPLPSLRFTVQEVFPSGRAASLDPSDRGVDTLGGGSYATVLGLNFQKVNKVLGDHYLRTRWSFAYSIGYDTKVRGFSAFGGGIGANGTAHPGKQFSSDLGFEYSLTRHWVPTLDILYNYMGTTTFTGYAGLRRSGLPATAGGPSASIWSIAPALEYNFNEKLGVVGGVWFSLAGRNASKFTSAAFAINYFI